MDKINASKRQIRIQTEEMPAFTKSDIVYGKILEKSGDRAVIQIGEYKVMASIDSSLPSSGNYWFKVAASKESHTTQLKILSKAEVPGEPLNAPKFILNMLKQANVAQTKENIDFLHQLLQDHPGINRKTLQQAMQFAAETGKRNSGEMMASISFALKRNLPLSRALLQSLSDVQSKETLYNQLKQLHSVLEPEDKLKAQIGKVISQAIVKDAEGLAGVLTFFQKKIGLKGEISLLQQLAKGAGLTRQEDSLKLLLLSASLNQADSAVKEKIDQVISKLNGQTLLSAEQGLTQHHFMQIPLHVGGFQSDLNIEWSGKKNDKGKIDPDYCRVLIYLTMNVLKDMMIDLHIQNRMMTVTIYQSTPFHPLLKKHAESLKETLKQQNYLLSSIKFENFKEAEDHHSHFMNKVMSRKHGLVKGVDIKV